MKIGSCLQAATSVVCAVMIVCYYGSVLRTAVHLQVTGSPQHVVVHNGFRCAVCVVLWVLGGLCGTCHLVSSHNAQFAVQQGPAFA